MNTFALHRCDCCVVCCDIIFTQPEFQKRAKFHKPNISKARIPVRFFARFVFCDPLKSTVNAERKILDEEKVGPTVRVPIKRAFRVDARVPYSLDEFNKIKVKTRIIDYYVLVDDNLSSKRSKNHT